MDYRTPLLAAALTSVGTAYLGHDALCIAYDLDGGVGWLACDGDRRCPDGMICNCALCMP